MEFDKKDTKKGSNCVVLKVNAYGTPTLVLNGVVEKIGLKYVYVKCNKSTYKFDFDEQVYKGIKCVDEFEPRTFLFKNDEDMKEYAYREKYLNEIKNVFSAPSQIKLSLEELKEIYQLLKKEK